jgi:N-dimethylarginine dimethylaminohydrolase
LTRDANALGYRTLNNEFTTRRRIEGGGTPRLDRWGSDSETGVLREVLVGPVDHFRNILPTNSINRKKIRNGFTLDVEGARSQYNELLSIFKANDVKVHITPADPDLPLQIWARDGSFMTPWGMVIGQMAQWWRRGEYGPVIDFCYQNELPIYEKITAGCLEGGDFMCIRNGAALIGYTGARSNEAGARQAQRWLEAEGWDVCLYECDEFFVHADVTIAMLGDTLAAVCTDVVPDSVCDWFRSLGVEIMDVPYKHADALGLNVLALGNDRALMPAAATYLADQCRALGFEVFDPDVSCITAAGGGIHCMCQPLTRDPVGSN